MNAATIVALTAACVVAQGQVQAARAEGAAAQAMAQVAVPDAPTVPDCEAREDISDRLRLAAQEYSHSGLPPSKEAWTQAVEQHEAEFDDRVWAWFQESVDAASTVAALREAHPDFQSYNLELIRTAMAIDANIINGPDAPTADELVLSVELQLMRQESAESVTFSQPHLVAGAAVEPHRSKNPEVWTAFAKTLRPHQDVYESFGYGTLDLLQAIYAASDNKQAMETHHLDSDSLSKMAGYQVAQRLMLDAMADVAWACATTSAPCRDARSCETLAEAAPQTCATAVAFCRASEQVGELGICDAFSRRCEIAIDCVHRTALGSGPEGNCVVESWKALQSSASGRH